MPSDLCDSEGMNHFIKAIPLFLISAFASSCTTTTNQGATGVHRTQLLLVSSEEINRSAENSYAHTKKQAASKNKLDINSEQYRRVNSIAQKIIPQTAIFRNDSLNWKWEVHVISSDELNAYCMPGGKIIFYSGIIDKIRMTDGEIAAVMGHEIAHALREHGRERMSEEIIRQKSIQLLVLAGTINEAHAGALSSLSNVIISLPHGRDQESEADVVGTELMARAGFNPREALSLWRKMASVGGDKPPEILSTHPSDTKRLEHINSLMPAVMPLYEQALKIKK